MRKLLFKEMRLSASVLSYLFLAFSLLTLVPNYPILVGGFFITFGIFQSFQTCRENNDILYSALLPVPKSDVVKSKYAFAVCIELCGFALTALLTLVRATALAELPAYRDGAMMNANLVFLGFSLLVFGLFNAVFLGGFFRTARRFGKPFVLYIVACFVTVCAAETLHHLPGLAGLNGTGADFFGVRLAVLFAGVTLYAALTLCSMRSSVRRFERIDL